MASRNKAKGAFLKPGCGIALGELLHGRGLYDFATGNGIFHELRPSAWVNAESGRDRHRSKQRFGAVDM